MKYRGFTTNVLKVALAAFVLAASLANAQKKARPKTIYPPAPHIAVGNGVVIDWSARHVIFSNPGTEQNAISKGTHAKWLRIVSDPRYKMRVRRRSAAANGQSASTVAAQVAQLSASSNPDWAVPLAPALGSVPQDQFAAAYISNFPNVSCTNDYVMFPVDAPGSSTQANLVGVNNLYKGTCAGTNPTVLYSYYVGSGVVQTSPALSLAGTKLAFVESVPNGSVFHVLTLDMSGNAGCATHTSPCNGTGYATPAVPGINNKAFDTAITISGNVSVTRSSPFIDFTGDVAYVGDDNGTLHQFTNVFQGTPAENMEAPWPLTIAAAGVMLTAPIYDTVNNDILMGGSDGNLYCAASYGAPCGNSRILVGTGPIIDGPTIDEVNGTVFAEANNPTNAVLTQATITLDLPVVNVTIGAAGTDLYSGDFDNAYENDPSTGHLYICGNLASAATPTLLRIGFNSSGTMNSATDGNSFQLVTSGHSGTAVDCSSITETYYPNGNGGSGQDLLFLSVKNNGFTSGSPNCNNSPCLMSFDVTSGFPTKANATQTSIVGPGGTSAFIVDGAATAPGASQIYFINPQNNTGTQVSAFTLQ